MAACSGGCLIVQDRSLSSCQTFVLLNRRGCAGIATLTGVRASGIPPAEASRDGCSETARAHLPADIFSTSVQLGAPPETPRQRPFFAVLDSRLEPSGPVLVPPRTQARPQPVIAIARSSGFLSRSRTPPRPRCVRPKSAATPAVCSTSSAWRTGGFSRPAPRLRGGACGTP
jgi:hypothetical protein